MRILRSLRLSATCIKNLGFCLKLACVCGVIMALIMYRSRVSSNTRSSGSRSSRADFLQQENDEDRKQDSLSQPDNVILLGDSLDEKKEEKTEIKPAVVEQSERSTVPRSKKVSPLESKPKLSSQSSPSRSTTRHKSRARTSIRQMSIKNKTRSRSRRPPVRPPRPLKLNESQLALPPLRTPPQPPRPLKLNESQLALPPLRPPLRPPRPFKLNESQLALPPLPPPLTQSLAPAQLQQPLLLANGRTKVRNIPKHALNTHWSMSPYLKGSGNASHDPGRAASQLPAEVDVRPSENSAETYEEEEIKTFATVFPCDGGQLNCYHDTMFPVEMCRHKCKQITNLTEADVVVFYVFKITQDEIVPNFRRPPGQRWVMMDSEPPCRKANHSMLDLPSLKGQFNWTLTFRLDSDIPWLYGHLRRVSRPPTKDYDAIFRQKSVTAAWFVGHCNTGSQRDLYAKYMQEYGGLQLHIYGACGNYTCTSDCSGSGCSRATAKRGSDEEICFPLLSEKYFFYLAFENSLCKDYVTEKFFKIFKGVNTIPVVRGGADHKRLLPPNTYVDAADFETPADLAVYLTKLSRDRERYTEMLREKDKYRFEAEGKWYCKLCDKMHSNKGKLTQWYPDLRTWYTDGQCQQPSDLFARFPGGSIPSRGGQKTHRLFKRALKVFDEN
ncbi:alpha-(1,3)-fucosyltransferase c-like [Plakobranchus ocellatus]|uniref:Fucosyltransferase n=1 Tax=Plakobranchus ocellatus TaxID=259542 RepID=A0AAV4DLV5_9GAST|nr:alpha-(1,3)-fucosyltransferase c-like [Plakobranchus ocellatus]